VLAIIRILWLEYNFLRISFSLSLPSLYIDSEGQRQRKALVKKQGIFHYCSRSFRTFLPLSLNSKVVAVVYTFLSPHRPLPASVFSANTRQHQSGLRSLTQLNGFLPGLLGSHLQLVSFPSSFFCLDCYSVREALRAFTQVAYLLSFSYESLSCRPFTMLVCSFLPVPGTRNKPLLLGYWTVASDTVFLSSRARARFPDVP
jgi:hypothetical protein